MIFGLRRPGISRGRWVGEIVKLSGLGGHPAESLALEKKGRRLRG
jgi:hypothetical protein